MIKRHKVHDSTIDILRILAILAVVLIHTTTLTIQTSSNNLSDFSFSLFLNQAARFAVPMFFFISGYVLELNYNFHTSYLSYLKNRASKIVIPYIFWSLFYYFLIFKNHSESFISALLNGDSSYQLYFIPALFIFYLIFPILHKNYKYISKLWILSLLAGMQLFILGLDYYLKPLPFFYPISIILLNYFVFIFGIFVAENKNLFLLIISKCKYVLPIFTLSLAIFIYIEGKLRYLKTLNYLSFYSQWRPSVFIYSLSIICMLFYFLKKIDLKKIHLKSLSNLSFFVYFIHIAILTKVWGNAGLLIFNQITTGGLGRIIFDPFIYTIVVIISFTIAFFVHKIPHLKIITG